MSCASERPESLDAYEDRFRNSAWLERIAGRTLRSTRQLMAVGMVKLAISNSAHHFVNTRFVG